MKLKGFTTRPGWFGDKESLGPAVAFFLAEDARSTVRWDIAVQVRTKEGSWRVGRIVTIPPALAQIQTGGPLTSTRRLIAIAYVPGAHGWGVSQATPIQLNTGIAPLSPEKAEAEFSIAPDKSCNACLPGLWKIDSDSTVRGPTGFQPQISQVLTSVIVFPAGNTLLLPEDQERSRALIIATAGAPGISGLPNTPAGQAFPLPSGVDPPPVEIFHHRAIFVQGPGTVALLVERG